MSSLDATIPSWLLNVEIRPITKADLPALEWDGEYTHFRRLYAEIYESASKGKAILWAADSSEKGLLGQLFVQLFSGRLELANGSTRAYIYGFRVKLPYRGYGIGTRLLQVAEADLSQRGFRWVTLNVGRDNPDALRLYERLGYRVVAQEPGRWTFEDDQGHIQHVHEPAWRMEKVLPTKGTLKFR